ncbi:hypothetical protein ACSQ67_025547 [Phaseolus vulgaris]
MYSWIWTIPEPKGLGRTTAMEAEKLNVVSEDCNSRILSICYISSCLIGFNNYVLQEKEVKRETKGIYKEAFKTQNAIQTLDKTISNLELELADCKGSSRVYTKWCSSEKRKKLEEEKGIIIRFVIGHRCIPQLFFNDYIA